ncbi:protein artichoke [Teleopsis dalmanni]|uniref:protein artichoke n=1 Tax=Teleopsis dalmanni TaxID=139649 RepID=UPI0018CFBFEE|nr:protein artichoke [Teleopsis dalmanni]
MEFRRSMKIPWWRQRNIDSFNSLKLLIRISIAIFLVGVVQADGCPASEVILPCRCSTRGKEIQIWCSHSNLPQIMDGIKAVEKNFKGPIDELVLENNQLPALPGRFFGNLQIVRLMLRYNNIERVSNGWLNELENSLVEIYIVEPQLRSIPVESLNGMINIVAITIQSDALKHLPDFTGLLSLTYLSVQSKSLTELQPHWFRHLPKLQNIHINGGPNLNRLESGLFDGLISLKNVDLSRNGISWIHLRALTRLPNLISLKLSYNQISDVGMVGRIIKDLENLKKLRLDHNIINIVEDGSFVDLPYLSELHLNDNRITEIQYGAFLRTPMLKIIYLHNNHIIRIHPESFLQASGSGVETVYIYNNEIEQVSELRSLLNALPMLKFLDISSNLLSEIPYGALRGHGTLEQLHVNNNLLRIIEHDALMAMPALRELRMRNNSLSSELPMPFWNLPGLKGLDLAANRFRTIDSYLLAGLPSLRRLDLSENGLTKIDPSTFKHNPMLETLNISHNELSNIAPATFRNLNRLFEVDASHNQLIEIIPGLPKIVERISVRGNSIAMLPPSISKILHLPNLRMLDLSLNHLEQMPKYACQGVPQLRVLSIANNRLRLLDDTTFIGAHRLELLHLQDNMLSQIDERSLLPMSELRNLNLQGNKLEIITDNMFSNNSHIEQLDLSRNLIRTISPAAFESQRSLEYLDISGNALTDISISLSSLANLRDIDLSYNQISRVHADVVSAWKNIVEIRLSNNLITDLKHGTFRNLHNLQYLDLSSNEINTVEPSALKNLPDLQEFVLADNKLVELKDHVFEDLPNLLASHFQYNFLRYISPESFYNSPSMVFLNLSNNNFHSLENIGLRSMRNLEVLDLSTNNIRTVSTMPLKVLSWLVELKLDNNEICKVQGSPFETMPRLRVLSMRNNRLRILSERTFRNLRGNIAILDVDGNPINCSCEMQWLSVWLQETNFPYPGPKCQDGRLLRSSRMEKSLCVDYEDNQRYVANENLNNLPLLNEHGDVFQRDLPDDFTEECDIFVPPGERPLAGESEYFYDQYVDYAPNNNSGSITTDKPTANIQLDTSNTVLSHQNRPTPVSPNIDLNNTILNTNFINKHQGLQSVQSSSPFTFFGYPLPSLSLGRFFGAGHRGRKDRGEKNGDRVNAPDTTSQMPATHRMHTSRAKERMYQPNSAEFEKYLKQEEQFQDVTPRSRYIESGSEEAASNETPINSFKTSFKPSTVERGGFRPIIPEHIGGFIPVHDPTRRGIVEAITTAAPFAKSMKHTKIENNVIPVNIKETQKDKSNEEKYNNLKIPQVVTQSTEIEDNNSDTYFVTEAQNEVTTSLRRITPPETIITTTMTTSAIVPVTSTKATINENKQPTTTSTTGMPTTENYIVSDFYDDLEAQSVGLLKPPPLIQTTTPETILLIPPPEEHMEQYKRHSWVTTTIATELTQGYATENTPMTTTRIARPSGGRSTITKVFTPQTLNHYLPTAEEFYRTTTSKGDYISASNSDPLSVDLPNAGISSQPAEVTPSFQVDRIDRKDGMEWYYESFKKPRSSGIGTGLEHKKIDTPTIRSSTESIHHSNAVLKIVIVNYVLFISLIFVINHNFISLVC